MSEQNLNNGLSTIKNPYSSEVTTSNLQVPSNLSRLNLGFKILETLYRNNTSIVYIASKDDEAITLYNEIKFFDGRAPIYLFLNLNDENGKILYNIISSDQKYILILPLSSSLKRLPPKEELLSCKFILKVHQATSQEKIISSLTRCMLRRVSYPTDNNEFSVRGSIIEFIFGNVAYRINLSFDEIESISVIDSISKIVKHTLNEIEIYPVSETLLNQDHIENFKQNFSKRFNNFANSTIYEAISNGIRIDGYESFAPLFYTSTSHIFDYIHKTAFVIHTPFLESSIDNFFSQVSSTINNNSSQEFSLNLEEIYLKERELKEILLNFNQLDITKGIENNLIPAPKFLQEAKSTNASPYDLLEHFIKRNIASKKIIFCCTFQSSIYRIKNILKSHKFTEVLSADNAEPATLNIGLLKLEESFIYKDYIFLSDQDILVRTSGKNDNKNKLKGILLETNNFQENEIIVHREYGIGKFLGIESLNIPSSFNSSNSGNSHDCIKLLYAGGDKLYVPVENIDLIKHYGSEVAELDKLGHVAWQKRKAGLKGRINEIAHKLLEIAARRSQTYVEPIQLNSEAYQKFCSSFPYPETEDQLNAVNSILEDLKANKPMDRLLCGDVGYGKTEVAMRAAFAFLASNLATSTFSTSMGTNFISTRRQVAIIVPTTILCNQHYNNFLNRFQGFGIKIAQLSRLVPAKTAAKVKESLSQGEIDIIIGTHALLGKNIKFTNLGFIIIDEEHHFGVKHKEALKALKCEVHTLSLSATPIPRTLQMSLFGIKDLSLLMTPPTGRLPINVEILRHDEQILMDAILKEYYRGGKILYIVPRITDIPDIEEFLRKIPNVKYRAIHGRMLPNMIEDTINDFYEGKFNIILSTTIIESGLDVPSANTIIIHRSDMFGLSQLYQLKGRVGRGKIKGHAYLTYDRLKPPSKEALKRMEILKDLDKLGSGFAIASHDMDMRGYGNLIGQEQSGHIKEVGIELYQDMLEEAINNLGTSKDELSTSVNLGLPVFIPSDYIEDYNLRIGIYRRLSDAKNLNELNNTQREIEERFGLLPLPLVNLIDVIRIKIACKDLSIVKFDSGPNGFSITFNFNYKDYSTKLLNFIRNFENKAKLKTEGKFVYLDELTEQNVLQKANLLISNLEQYFLHDQ